MSQSKERIHSSSSANSNTNSTRSPRDDNRDTDTDRHRDRDRDRERERERDRDGDTERERERERDKGRERDRDGHRDRDRDRDRDRRRRRDEEEERITSEDEKARKSADRHQKKEKKKSKKENKKDKKKEKRKKNKKTEERSAEKRRKSSKSNEEESAEKFLSLIESSIPASKEWKPPSNELTVDDYYSKSSEFRYWLHQTLSLHIDNIPSTLSHQLFQKFIELWNKGALNEKYYKGINSSSIEKNVLTNYQWSFTKKMPENEKLLLETMKDQVDSSTFQHSYQQEFLGQMNTGPPSTSTSVRPQSSSSSSTSSTNIGVTSNSRNSSSSSSFQSNKRYREERELMLDEIAPRETGREAEILKKKAKSEYSRGGIEAGGDLVGEVNESVLMGSSGRSEYQALREKEREREKKKLDEREGKAESFAEKEKEKMRKLLASIGQADKYKI